jgi:hypothetical protein
VIATKYTIRLIESSGSLFINVMNNINNTVEEARVIKIRGFHITMQNMDDSIAKEIEAIYKTHICNTTITNNKLIEKLILDLRIRNT